MDNTKGQSDNTDQQSSLQKIWDVGASSSATSFNPTNVHSILRQRRLGPQTGPVSPAFLYSQYMSHKHVMSGRSHSSIPANQLVVTQPMQTFSPSINYPDQNQPSTSRYIPVSTPISAQETGVPFQSSIEGISQQSIQDSFSTMDSPNTNFPNDSVYENCGLMEDHGICENCFPPTSNVVESPQPETERQIGSMRGKGEYDLTIKVGSKEIFAHKDTLSAGSSYFAEKLSQNMKIFEINELEPTCVEKCVNFIYTGIPPKLDDDIEPLMHAARLVAPKLFNHFAKILDESLRLENFTATWKLATLNDIKRLEEKCENFVRLNFKIIFKNESFILLDENLMKKFLQFELQEFQEFQERRKLHALLRWVKFAFATREKSMDEMLEFISISKIHVQYLRHLIEKEPLINSNASRIKTLSLCVMNKTAPKSMSYEELGENYQIMIFDEESGYLQKFNPADNSIEEMQKMDEEMYDEYCSAVCVGDYIYVLMINGSVYRLLYSNEEATWEEMDSFTGDHGMWPPVVTFNNCIYIIGGDFTESVEKYDTHLDEWIKLLDELSLQSHVGSTPAVFHDQIYFCGGYLAAEQEMTNAVERFDPVDLTLTTIAPMKEARASASAVSFDGKLYVLGGFDEEDGESNTVECYDGYAWTTLKPMIMARHLFQSFEINGDIYAVGGIGCKDSIEKYSFDKDEWQVIDLSDIRIRRSVKIRI